MSGQPQQQGPKLLPNVQAACDRVLDTIQAETEDVHDGSAQLNGALQYIHERLQKAQQEAINDLNALVSERRRNRADQKAMERIAAVKVQE